MAEIGRGAAGDRILDFQTGIDTIVLRAIDANVNVPGNQAFVFIGAAAFTGQARQLPYVQGTVRGDVDGDGLADFALQIANAAPLTAADFLL